LTHVGATVEKWALRLNNMWHFQNKFIYIICYCILLHVQ